MPVEATIGQFPLPSVYLPLLVLVLLRYWRALCSYRASFLGGTADELFRHAEYKAPIQAGAQRDGVLLFCTGTDIVELLTNVLCFHRACLPRGLT